MKSPAFASFSRPSHWLRAALAVVSLAAGISLMPGADGASAQNAQGTALKTAMDLVRRQDFDGARAQVSGIGRDIVDWHALRAGRGTLGEYQSFIARHADWPGMPFLIERGEAILAADGSPADVLTYFATLAPQTGTGGLALALAYRALGQTGDAAAQAALTWRTMTLSEADEVALLAAFGGDLKGHHEARLDMLLWRQHYTAAQRLYPMVSAGWQALSEARIALGRDTDGVDALIAAVPAKLAGDPGLAFERLQWRARKGRWEDATTLMLQVSTSVDALGQPEAWADRRRGLAREMMGSGKPKLAYQLASRHYLNGGDDYADLEWLAGYVALRYLNDPKTALAHFNRFRVAVKSPISLGRAGYWEGRALEALGLTEDASAAYRFGANYQTSFYGLLAAERAGLPMDPALMGTETYPDWQTARFANSSVLLAGLLLDEAGELPIAARFLRHLGESLTPMELGQLGDLALSLDEPYIALSVAKFAADQGVVLNRAYYPLPEFARGSFDVPSELVLSIARRESEFYPRAKSGAGAAGLMQLMPGTAAQMAKAKGLTHTDAKLLDDPAYNLRLGSGYLAKLMQDFGSNPLVVTAAYNAGPNRVAGWLRELGDPRAGKVDPIDWIEHIPYTETRNYVMRVVESIPVYRARLSGQVAPLTMMADMTVR